MICSCCKEKAVCSEYDKLCNIAVLTCTNWGLQMLMASFLIDVSNAVAVFTINQDFLPYF